MLSITVLAVMGLLALILGVLLAYYGLCRSGNHADKSSSGAIIIVGGLVAIIGSPFYLMGLVWDLGFHEGLLWYLATVFVLLCACIGHCYLTRNKEKPHDAG